MDEQAFHPLDYVSVLRRRKWWLITPVLRSASSSACCSRLFWPRQYLSEAQIGIAAPKLTPELLRNVSSLDREERQRAISQQLVSRQVLERVVREEKLNPSKPVEDVAGWLRTPDPRRRRPANRPRRRQPERARQLQARLHRFEPRSRPEHHQPAGLRVRRRELQDPDRARGKHVGSARPAVAGQPGATGHARVAAAREEGSQHGEAARPGRRQPRDGRTVCGSRSTRTRCSSAANRIGSRSSSRRSTTCGEGPSRRRSRPRRPRRIHGHAGAASTQLQKQLTQEKALGKTDKHPDIISAPG